MKERAQQHGRVGFKINLEILISVNQKLWLFGVKQISSPTTLKS